MNIKHPDCDEDAFPITATFLNVFTGTENLIVTIASFFK